MPSLESANSKVVTSSEDKRKIAYLCNPNIEDVNVHGYHVSQFFSNELDDVEKPALAEGCKGERLTNLLTFQSKWLFR